jgi:hypothetical protein
MQRSSRRQLDYSFAGEPTLAVHGAVIGFGKRNIGCEPRIEDGTVSFIGEELVESRLALGLDFRKLPFGRAGYLVSINIVIAGNDHNVRDAAFRGSRYLVEPTCCDLVFISFASIGDIPRDDDAGGLLFRQC